MLINLSNINEFLWEEFDFKHALTDVLRAENLAIIEAKKQVLQQTDEQTYKQRKKHIIGVIDFKVGLSGKF